MCSPIATELGGSYVRGFRGAPGFIFVFLHKSAIPLKQAAPGFAFLDKHVSRCILFFAPDCSVV